MATESTDAQGKVEKSGTLHRLYTGTGAFDIVGKRKRWYLAFGLLVLVCLASMGLRGFNLGIDFEGGTKIQMPAVGVRGPIETNQVQDSFRQALGHPAETVQVVGSGASESIQVRTDSLSPAEVGKVKQALFTNLQPVGANNQPSESSISDSAVSGTWGGEITQQALLALGVFLVLVTAFLAFYFEKWMAVAALLALLNDVVVTAGIYSLVGLEVTPSTVIGLLTILGFSLYDTVVVFDKVKENTRGLLGLTRRTYGEAANLAVNQTLMRSINTSIVALLPVIGLLIVGAGLLGVGVLLDLAMVQMVGMIAGVVSSIYLATPLLVDFKMRDPKYRSHAAKVRQRRDRTAKSGEPEETPSAEDDEPADDNGEELATAGASQAPSPGPVPEPSAPTPSNKSRGKSRNRPSNRQPAGKTNRPTGKKRR